MLYLTQETSILFGDWAIDFRRQTDGFDCLMPRNIKQDPRSGQLFCLLSRIP